MVIWFLAALIVLLTLSILYLVVPQYGLVAKKEDGPWALNTAPAIPADNVNMFTTNLNATLRVFYNIESLPRTSSIIVDATTSPSSFNTQTNTYDICEVGGAVSCAHPGFVKLLNLADSFYIEVLQAPDASRPGLPKTQLVVKTVKNQTVANANANVSYLETFALPEFPIQKWVMLTVVRNGNRINIYYNDKLVFSKNTTYIPSTWDGAGQFSEGQVKGQAKFLMTTDKASSASDVHADFVQMADTRGEPLEKLFSAININLCPSGDCFSGPSIRPANPLIAWSSDVM